MIDVKEAVRSARAYAMDLFQLDPETSVPTLEEVELTSDGAWWLITVGIDVPTRGPFAPLEPFRRAYKVIKIDAGSGRVQSVKMREAA